MTRSVDRRAALRLDSARRPRNAFGVVLLPSALRPRDRELERAAELRAWYARFEHRADFARAFRELPESGDFFVEALRGRLRSLELRFGDAWRHFGRAELAARREPESAARLVRGVLLEMFRFEANFVAFADEPSTCLLPPLGAPESISDTAFAACAELRAVLEIRWRCEAVARLRSGQFDDAAEAFRRLDRLGATSTASRVETLLWEAIAARVAGRCGLAATRLEVAGSVFDGVDADAGVTRTLLAARLVAGHELARDEVARRRWKQLFDGIAVPEPTRKLCLERARRQVRGCLHAT